MRPVLSTNANRYARFQDDEFWKRALGYWRQLTSSRELCPLEMYPICLRFGTPLKLARCKKATSFLEYGHSPRSWLSAPIRSPSWTLLARAVTFEQCHCRFGSRPLSIAGCLPPWSQRAVSRHPTPWGEGISENVIGYVVRRCAERMQLDQLAPHDLRRTSAKLAM
jgi:hypothetical protein